MGLTVKRNKENKYQLISGISDERLHKEKWISEKEAKKILIGRAFWRFFQDVMDIDCEFPGGYSCNGKVYERPKGVEMGVEKHLRFAKAKNSNELLKQEWERLKKEYDLDI